MWKCQKLSISMNSHNKMSNLTAEIHMFTVWYKKHFHDSWTGINPYLYMYMGLTQIVFKECSCLKELFGTLFGTNYIMWTIESVFEFSWLCLLRKLQNQFHPGTCLLHQIFINIICIRSPGGVSYFNGSQWGSK